MSSVNLTKRIRTTEGLRYCPIVESRNGRIKPDTVIVNGSEELHPEGAYYVEWREGGKRRRLSVGTNPANALARRLRKEAELDAIKNGVVVVPEVNQNRLTLASAIPTYLEEIGISKKPKTLSAYRVDLQYFQESCRKVYIADIDRMDMLRYAAFLRDEKEHSDRTVANKFENVLIFLKSVGRTNVVQKNDWPQYTLSEPEIYEKEELDQFFAACESNERLLFEFFLMTGFREQEVIYSMWRNVNFKQGTVSMTKKSEYNWTPKGYKEREVPIPTKLMTALKAASPENGKNTLLFPTDSGKPKKDYLHILKGIVRRAGMDPNEWWLHKFRATFATWHLQTGVDVVTVQKWLGHKDLESTLRYLRPARGVGVQAKVNETFG